MVTKKDLVVSILCTFCLTTVLLTMMPVQSAEWNPWLDVTEDGRVNVLDLIKTAGALGTMGDTTKNVNVTNWPISRDVSVWWLEDVVPGGLVSSAYDAGGFGHLHVLAVGTGLSGAETLTVNIRGRLYNEARTSWIAVTVYTLTLTSSSNTIDVSISVPSEMLYFTVPYDVASSCAVSLSFYLTWA